jgi:ParB/RepB/Spo0J family partition protein
MSKTTETPTLNETSRRNMFFMDPRGIMFDPAENPRVDYGELKELEASIAQHGVKDPIWIKNTPEGPKLIHGFRRMTATMNLINRGEDVARIPCIPVPKGYSEEDALLDHIIRNSGKPLTAMEEAGVYKTMIGKGYKQTEIAKMVGKTQGAISNILKLSQTSKVVQNYINEGLIASSLVMKLIKEQKNDHKAVERIVVNAIEKLDGTKNKKVTDKTVMVKRVSKYHRMFTGSLEVMRENSVDEKKIAKVEAIMEALDADSPEALADQILAIL